MKAYTGIGARKTPKLIAYLMYRLAYSYGKHKEYTLRSGGAKGADAAFELGADAVNAPKEIYLPYDGFENKSATDKGCYSLEYMENSDDAQKLALKFFPNLKKSYALKYFSRNMYQVLGEYLKSPSDFVMCWTPKGEEVGGTRAAIVIAKDYDVPVINLYDNKKVIELMDEHNIQTLTYQGNYEVLEDNEVFVFGSNLQGFHGSGNAGYAAFGAYHHLNIPFEGLDMEKNTKGAWAVMGVAEGLQEGKIGMSYALPTVKSAGDRKSLSKEQMISGIQKLYKCCNENKTKWFILGYGEDPYLRCGYSLEEFVDLFIEAGDRPRNLVLNNKFHKIEVDKTKEGR